MIQRSLNVMMKNILQLEHKNMQPKQCGWSNEWWRSVVLRIIINSETPEWDRTI